MLEKTFDDDKIFYLYDGLFVSKLNQISKKIIVKLKIKNLKNTQGFLQKKQLALVFKHFLTRYQHLKLSEIFSKKKKTKVILCVLCILSCHSCLILKLSLRKHFICIYSIKCLKYQFSLTLRGSSCSTKFQTFYRNIIY